MPTSEPPNRPAPPPRAASGRWLVVDDEAAWRDCAGRLLRTALGAQVHFAADGLEAIVAMDSQDYDVVLMDGAMPFMDGAEATQLLRQRGHRALIIGVAGEASPARRGQALAAGMDAFLGKPLCAVQLAECLAQLGPRAPGARSRVRTG
ncbi:MULTISPECIES: response regulator [Ramlibacter]|uniref:Response regulator n=1 Tax=Ramlibacter aquaticus TaxID=2780094 RepID=A0ABR9SC42_9BURK|nr:MULTISPECIES: response regulator [Ramlibacter]MBE7939871.1 response regulator [Ramlibacter aquaticus]